MPLSLYFKDGRAKVEIALARGDSALARRHALRARLLSPTGHIAERAQEILAPFYKSQAVATAP